MTNNSSSGYRLAGMTKEHNVLYCGVQGALPFPSRLVWCSERKHFRMVHFMERFFTRSYLYSLFREEWLFVSRSIYLFPLVLGVRQVLLFLIAFNHSRWSVQLDLKRRKRTSLCQLLSTRVKNKEMPVRMRISMNFYNIDVGLILESRVSPFHHF